MDSVYDDSECISKEVAEGRHREVVGGMWEEIGRLQFEFVKNAGLLPEHFLLDVGCGSLRGGVHFVRYLDHGHYCGIDINKSLLDAGYSREIAPVSLLAGKLPPQNLACIGDFDVSCFGRSFDFAIAQSLFSHLSFNRIRLCLEKIAKAVIPGGKFFATYFNIPENNPYSVPFEHSPGGIVTFGHQDPYHYKIADFHHAIRNMPWQLDNAGDWNHPRAQWILTFTRI